MDLLNTIQEQLLINDEKRCDVFKNLGHILYTARKNYGLDPLNNKDTLNEVKLYFTTKLKYLWPLMSKNGEPKYIYSLFENCNVGLYKYGYNDPYNNSLNMLLIRIKNNKYKSKLFYYNRMKIKKEQNREKWMGLDYAITKCLEIESRKLIFIRYVVAHFPIIDDLKLKILEK